LLTFSYVNNESAVNSFLQSAKLVYFYFFKLTHPQMKKFYVDGAKCAVILCTFFGFLLTFNTSAANLYWIGGNGNWSSTAHWSASSGGASCGCTPTVTDNVYFDANSFSANGQSVTVDVVAYCDSMDWSGIVHTTVLTGSQNLHINGSLILSPNSSVVNLTGNIYFESANANNRIVSAGKSFGTAIYFTGTGDWTLQDPFVTSGNLYLSNGTLSTNNQNLTFGTFSSTGNSVRSLILGSSTVTVTGGGSSTAWGVSGSNFSLDAGTSLIKFTTTGSYTYLTAGTNDIYYDVVWVNPGTGGYINGGGATFHNVTSNGGGSFSPGNGSFFNDITFAGLAAGTVSPGTGSTVHDVIFGGNGTISAGTGSIFHDITFGGTANISTNGNTFRDVVFNGNASVSNTNGSFQNAYFVSDASITSSNSFDSLIFSPAHVYTLSYNTTQTINSYFKADGNCSQLVTLQSNSAGNQAIISKSSGTVAISYVSMTDIKATGGANFIATNCSNLSNNTGWTIATPATQDFYWIGGSGNWSNTAHWSNTSGGAPASCIPTKYDNVFFDANSFTTAGQSVTIDVVAYCDSMDWSGISFGSVMTGTFDLHVFGSLKLSSQLNPTNFSGNLYVESPNSGNRIVSSGRVFGTNIYFTGAGGWGLQDAFSTNGSIYLLNGTLSSNNNNITCGTFNSTGNNARALVLGSTTVTVTGGGSGTGWNVGGSNFSLAAGTSLIKFTTTGSYTYLTAGTNDIYNDVIWINPGTGAYINGGSSTYHNITSNGGGSITPGNGSFINDVIFNGSAAGTVSPGSSSTVHDVIFGGDGTVSPGIASTFHDVTFGGTAAINTTGTNFNNVLFNGVATVSNPTGNFKKADFRNDANLTGTNSYDSLFFASSHTYKLTSGTTQNVNVYWTANGACGQLITLQSNTAGSQATISKGSGTVTVNYMSLKDISAMGGATFVANNATDLGDNSGWTIHTAGGQNLYWVGGTGNWSNPSHWSNTSGGAPGNCIPTIYDNVYFDANSFTANGQSVTIDIVAYCDSMDWSGISHSNILTGASDLHIYGSLKLSPNSSVINYTGNLYFASNNSGNRITSAGKVFATTISFVGTGDWTLQDAFATTSNLYLSSGALNTDSNNFSMSTFNSTGANVRSLMLGTSTVTVTGGGSGTAWNITGSNFALDAGTSLIKFTTTNGYTYFTAGTNDVYYDLLWVNPGTSAYINGGSSTYHNVISNGGGTISPGAGSFFNDVAFVGTNSAYFNPGSGSSAHNITFNGPGFIQAGSSCTFNDVTFNSTASINTSGNNFRDVIFNGSATVTNGGGLFKKADFRNDATLGNAATFDSLLFATGHTYTLASNYIQTINYYFKADGTCTQGITIKAATVGTQAIISKATGTVTVSYVSMKDIAATGGASFNAASSTNVSDNSGWNFPTAVLSASYTHTQNALAVTFNNTSQYATSYLWDFGDGSNATTQSPVHSYASPGSYNVCLIASDACGAKDTLCQSLTVCSPLATGFTYTVTGQTINFTNISQNASSFLWNFGDGGTSTAQSPFHTYYFAGGYYVTLIASSACGAKDTIRQFISVNCTSPVAGFAASPNGLLVNFVNSSTNAANVLWNYGDGITSTLFNAPHTYFNTGTYNICLIAKNGCGSDTLCQNVTVNCVAPVAAYSYLTSGMTVTFTNNSTNAPIAFWDFGDGQTSAQNSPSHVYNNAGAYNVKLVVHNGCGIDSVIQAVNIVCVLPVASYATSQQGLSVDFLSTSTNAPNVVWDFGDGTGISILPAVTHTYMATGVYNVCLTASNGCGSDTYCTTVSVCTPPTANFTYADSALTLNLTNTSLNGMNYYWNFGDSSVTNLANPTHVFANSGVHTVCLTVSNSCGFSQLCKNVMNYCSYYMDQQICMLTVDSLSQNNIIYWEKTNVTGIDSFVIYREVSSNTYKRIGAVSKDSMSMFIDTARSVGPANGDPNVGTYRYKLQAVDSCGNYGPKSLYHNTVFFVDNHTGSFVWNKYLIEGQSNTPITQFNLLRDNANNGIWIVIGTVAGTQTTLNDPNYNTYSNIANWRVEALGFSCTPAMRYANGMMGTIVRSKSNICNNRGIGIQEIQAEKDPILVYPNPTNGTVYLQGISELGLVTIYNSLGEVVFQQHSNDTLLQADLSKLRAGVYSILVKGRYTKIILE
jgi:PKD repeat protein